MSVTDRARAVARALRQHRTATIGGAAGVILLANLVAIPLVGGGDSQQAGVVVEPSPPDATQAETPDSGVQDETQPTPTRSPETQSSPTAVPDDDAGDDGGTGGTTDDGDTGGGAATTDGSTTGDSTDGGATSTDGGTTGDSTGGGTTTTDGGTGTDGDPPSSDARGVTDTEVRVGFWIVNTDAGCGAIGLTEEGTSCQNADREQIKALAQHVNENGGVAGRDLAPIIHESDATNSTFAAQAQAACSTFTEDHEVFAVVSEGQIGRPHMAHCLHQSGIPTIDPGFWPFDDKLYAELAPHLYQPSRPRPERWIAAYIDGLADQGFFTATARVGLLRFDAAPFDRVTENVLKPKLQDHGKQLVEEIEIQTPDSVAAFGQMNQELNNAILQLRSSGVDHVIFFATHGEMASFYFDQAESQSYRPRYGMSSLESLRLQSEEGPPAQFTDAVGVGWMPQFDVFPQDDPGGSQTANLCQKVLQEAGLEGGAGRHTQCDNVFFLDTVLDRAPSLDASGFRTAVEELGSSWEPAATFETEFGPDRYDGPAGLRYVGWTPECECFKYKGGTRALP